LTDCNHLNICQYCFVDTVVYLGSILHPCALVTAQICTADRCTLAITCVGRYSSDASGQAPYCRPTPEPSSSGGASPLLF
jgi:hypothetical protein